MERRSDVPGPIITLTTDIGEAYAAQMKAVLLTRCPRARLVDISHTVPPHQVAEGAFLMRYTGVHFPSGTVHVGIVDPGVGSSRQAIVIACRDGGMLVGPDNGLLWPLAVALGKPRAYRIRRSAVVGTASVHPTFEGRDLFAPAAAKLANGARPGTIGEPTVAKELELPRPRWTRGSVRAAVLYIDRFGNLITNVPFKEVLARWGPNGSRLRLDPTRGSRLARALRLARTYSELRRGELGMLGSSFGLAEVVLREGSAARRLRVSVGSQLEVARAGPSDAAARS